MGIAELRTGTFLIGPERAGGATVGVGGYPVETAVVVVCPLGGCEVDGCYVQA